MKVFLNIAGFNIQVNFNSSQWEFLQNEFKKNILNYYRGFIINEKKDVDYKINIIEKRWFEVLIKKRGRKRFINIYEEKDPGVIITFYQISLIQFQLILRDILEKLLTKNGGFIIHASSVDYHGKALVFTGRNGSGKSTAMKLLHPQFQALADDTVIIRKELGQFFAYQTPFIEKEAWVRKRKGGYLIEGIFFLRKANQCKLEKITDKNYILDRLVNQFWSEDNYYRKQLKYLIEFVSRFNNFYFLYFAKDREKLIRLIS